MMRLSVANGIFVLLFLLASLGVEAKLRKLDSVVALVGDNPITKREVYRKMADIRTSLRANKVPLPSPEVLQQQAFQQIISETSQLAEAKTLGIGMTEDEIDQAIQTIAQRNAMPLSDFIDKVSGIFGSYSAYREKVGRELIVSKLLQSEIINKMEIKEEAMKESMIAMGSSLRWKFLYVSVPVPAKGEVRRKILGQIVRLKEKVEKNGDFAYFGKKLAKTHDWKFASTGWIDFEHMPEALSGRIMDVSQSGLLPIFTGKDRIYLFYLADALDEKRGEAPMRGKTRYFVRHILLLTNPLQTDAKVKRKLIWIKDKIAKGEDFGKLAKAFSQDPGSAFRGGELGWVTLEGLDPAFAEGVRTVKPKQLQGPFKGGFGWHLLEVVRREESMVPVVRQLERTGVANIRRNRLESRRRAWVLGLREKYPVVILSHLGTGGGAL